MPQQVDAEELQARARLLVFDDPPTLKSQDGQFDGEGSGEVDDPGEEATRNESIDAGQDPEESGRRSLIQI